jgi:hypothetical protein
MNNKDMYSSWDYLAVDIGVFVCFDNQVLVAVVFGCVREWHGVEWERSLDYGRITSPSSASHRPATESVSQLCM